MCSQKLELFFDIMTTFRTAFKIAVAFQTSIKKQNDCFAFWSKKKNLDMI
jgi:hypothetical protein